MANFLLGRDAHAYWSTTLLTGSNTSTVLGDATVADNIIDLSLDIESEFVDSTTRSEAAQGFSSEIAVLRGGRIMFDARWKPGDTFTDELIDVWEGTNEEMAFFALDQDKATANPATIQGLAANVTVSISKQESLRDIQKMSVTLAISSHPVWHKFQNDP